MAGTPENSSSDYSFIDRMMHRVAFAHPHIQRALSEIESDMFASKFENAGVEAPVFVTGLPRAGTTFLLEMFYGTGEFSTFTYRNMPFLLAPLFWASVSSSFQKKGETRERAHGDGMEVSFDSPEAFEEVVWLNFLRDQFVHDDHLSPVTPGMADAEFRTFFTTLIRKLTAANGAARYLSKNNANIGRLNTVAEIFNDATIFVCLREPAAHVRSLMTQHDQFLTMHDEDEFARSYMKWIGHYDFGANFKPIDFHGRGGVDPAKADVNFWLQYWIDAYEFARDTAGANVNFFCYENLFENPARALSATARAAAIADIDAFAANSAKVRAPTTETAPLENADLMLLQKADALYRALKTDAL
ncbi:MAG: sulfotransferase [Parvularculaceae bacterium]|nr:sulfotransferase [Parvularculaceae bacterium]